MKVIKCEMKLKQQSIVPKQTPNQNTTPKKWLKKIQSERVALSQLFSAIGMIWFSLLLVYGVTTNIMNEFYRVVFFLRHPVTVVINSVTFLAALIHTTCWFNSLSNKMNSKRDGKRVVVHLIRFCCWLIPMSLSVISVLILLQ